MSVDLAKLRVIHYPDPRLRQTAKPVARFDDALLALGRRMLELMRAEKGVGLAAPQVGVMLRLFVANHTGEAGDDRIICNPTLSDLVGGETAEEGCLSLPEVRVQVRRAMHCRLRAVDAAGKPIDLEADGFAARVWQHETDHLNGVLILDRMGPTDRIAVKKTLAALEDSFRRRGRR
ncbi:MAG: peptide deformylase [Phycisphaerae bacterium]